MRRRAAWLGALAVGCALLVLQAAGPDAPVRSPRVDDASGSAASRGRGATPAPLAARPPQASPAAADTRAAERLAQALEHHLRAVARDGDARQRLIALYLLTKGAGGDGSREDAQALARRLHAEAPDDEVLAMALSWFCADDASCHASAAEAWAASAPDNGAAQVAMLTDGLDARGVDEVLARAAQAERFDGHWNTLQLEVFNAFDGLALPPPDATERAALREAGLGIGDVDRRLLLGAGFAAAIPSPGIFPLVASCRPPLSAARTRNCFAVLTAMARANTLLERSIAFSMLERLTRGTAQHAQWAAAQRDSQWQREQFARLPMTRERWIDLIEHGEVVAMLRALQHAGIALHAPPTWRPRFG